jgi:hypothetical protein
VGFTCSICGRWHESELLDVRALLPEDVLRLDEAERERSVATAPGGDFTSILDADRHFVRALIELPIGEGGRFGWGVWVRVSREDVADLARRWDDADAYGRTYRGHLATQLAVYGDTLDLAGTVTLRETNLLPIFLLDRGDHPLGDEQHGGITLARARQLAEPYRGDRH